MANVPERGTFERILEGVRTGEIKLGSGDFTFGGGSSTAPTATEEQQKNLDFLLDKAARGELTQANKDFLMSMTGVRYGPGQRERLAAVQESLAGGGTAGSPGTRAGMLIGAAQGQRSGTGGAAVGAQPPRGPYGGPVGIDRDYYAGLPYVDYIQTDEGTVAVDQDGNIVSGGIGRSGGTVSTQPVGEPMPIRGGPVVGDMPVRGGGGGDVGAQESTLNQQFLAFLESLGLTGLLELFAQGGYGTPTSTYDPSAEAIDKTKVGYDPYRGAYNVPAVMQPGSAAYKSGLFNYIYAPYTQPMAPLDPMAGITVPTITDPIQGM